MRDWEVSLPIEKIKDKQNRWVVALPIKTTNIHKRKKKWVNYILDME